jgi:hypothetical protein
MTVDSSPRSILTASLSLVYRQPGLWRQSENAPQAESQERPGFNPEASHFHRELVMQNKMPAGVTVASTCLSVGGILLLLFSAGMLLGGLFAGLHVLVAGVLTAGLGYPRVSASAQLSSRTRSSRSLGIVWGIIVALLAVMGVSFSEKNHDWIVLLIFCVCCGISAVCVLIVMILPSTREWLDHPDGPGSGERTLH